MIAVASIAVAFSGWACTGAYAARLRRCLRTDALTGLGNRLALREAVEYTQPRAGNRMAVLLLDLDGFKSINDTFGHRCGDQVLIDTAHRLRVHQGRGRLAVRLSGDEFAFWTGHAASEDAVDQLRQTLLTDVARPLVVHGHTLTVGASIGAATSIRRPAHLEALLETADLAMYQHKRERSVTSRLPRPERVPRRRTEVA